MELRGAGRCSRQVNNFCTPAAFEADKLIACEVLTPGGNWSSYPPHKHDEARDGECELEEIYYFEVAGGGMGYQRVYGTEDRPIDVLAEVRTDDVVLIPHGWHGPSMATPGYDLYYLNVMAGPGTDPRVAHQRRPGARLDPRDVGVGRTRPAPAVLPLIFFNQTRPATAGLRPRYPVCHPTPTTRTHREQLSTTAK